MSATKTPQRALPRRAKSLRNRAVDEVGYRRPPRAHQFKPGQSGNPRGRPKGAKNEATILRAILNRKIEIREGARARKVTIREAILLGITEDALKRNIKAADFVFTREAASQVGDSQPKSNFILNITLQDHYKRLERLGLPIPQIEGDYEPEDGEQNCSPPITSRS